MNRDDYVNSLKAAFVSTSSRIAKTELAVALPWTLSPVIAPVIDYVLSHILQGIADHADSMAFFAYIDSRGVAQGRDFADAANALRLARQAGDAVKIKAAEQNVREKLRALVAFTN